jgi:hypothetical protein
MDILYVPLTCCSRGDLDVPYPTATDQLVGYLDATYETCVQMRRSMGDEFFFLAGVTLMHRAKWIVVICTSSTEAEFVVRVQGGKNYRYICSILNKLGIMQLGPMMLNVDIIATILMANDINPIKHSHHIDIQLFALLT